MEGGGALAAVAVVASQGAAVVAAARAGVGAGALAVVSLEAEALGEAEVSAMAGVAAEALRLFAVAHVARLLEADQHLDQSHAPKAGPDLSPQVTIGNGLLQDHLVGCLPHLMIENTA